MNKVGDLYFHMRGSSYTIRLSPLYKPYHLFGFSPRTLPEMVRQCGFEVLEVIVSPGRNDFAFDRPFLSRLEKLMRGVILHIGGKLGMGEVLTLFARKS